MFIFLSFLIRPWAIRSAVRITVIRIRAIFILFLLFIISIFFLILPFLSLFLSFPLFFFLLILLFVAHQKQPTTNNYNVIINSYYLRWNTKISFIHISVNNLSLLMIGWVMGFAKWKNTPLFIICLLETDKVNFFDFWWILQKGFIVFNFYFFIFYIRSIKLNIFDLFWYVL